MARTWRPAAMRGMGGVLLSFAALGLAACGFSPLYAPASDGSTSPAVAELAAIRIDRIPDRSGQELSEDLQNRFNLGGVGVQQRYDLEVNYGITEQGIGIQPDTSVTYQRVIATAAWTLRAMDPQRTVVTTGKARAIDGYNYIDQQFFDSTLEDEKVRWRLANQIADQITAQLVSYFKHPPPGATASATSASPGSAAPPAAPTASSASPSAPSSSGH